MTHVWYSRVNGPQIKGPFDFSSSNALNNKHHDSAFLNMLAFKHAFNIFIHVIIAHKDAGVESEVIWSNLSHTFFFLNVDNLFSLWESLSHINCISNV